MKIAIPLLLVALLTRCENQNAASEGLDIATIDREWILENAGQYLSEAPITVTTSWCERSAGGKHDFYSEGDYWWPNPEDPDGPYIRKDGLTNPDNFTDHRRAMRRMSLLVATLTAAYKITGEAKYADQTIKHLKAWFVEDRTKMNPDMQYSQAIKGIVTGRGIGLIDGIHLVEPARAVSVLQQSGVLAGADYEAIRQWFADFLAWMTTHRYGLEERDSQNNHATCWVMQAAEYAHLTDNQEILQYCRERYKTVLLPNQVSPDGGFHLELQRTKPYGYSLFNLDAMAMVCRILTTGEENLWTFTLADGRSMQKALAFIYPFIKDKSTWPYQQDVMYWDEWPVRHPALLFGGLALQNFDYINLWKTLAPLPKTEEGLRNFPIRQPVLWLSKNE